MLVEFQLYFYFEIMENFFFYKDSFYSKDEGYQGVSCFFVLVNYIVKICVFGFIIKQFLMDNRIISVFYFKSIDLKYK